MATAERVSANINRDRSCTIEITNKSDEYGLANPQFYTYSGYCCHPPQTEIISSGVCAFAKKLLSQWGTAGVLTYDLYDTQKQVCTGRLAILFSVPDSYIFFNNIFGVGVFEITRKCDEDLYDYMYDGKDFGRFTRGKAKESGITKALRVELRATMSNECNAIIKVEIHDKAKNEKPKYFLA